MREEGRKGRKEGRMRRARIAIRVNKGGREGRREGGRASQHTVPGIGFWSAQRAREKTATSPPGLKERLA